MKGISYSKHDDYGITTCDTILFQDGDWILFKCSADDYDWNRIMHSFTPKHYSKRFDRRHHHTLSLLQCDRGSCACGEKMPKAMNGLWRLYNFDRMAVL